MVTIIVAAARDGAIGKNGDLLWHLSGDLKRFRQLTTGQVVIMGRKTWESLPKRPLPDRLNIVITRDLSFEAPGALIAHSLKEALELGKNTEGIEKEIFIIGGESIYRQALPLTDAIDFTLIDSVYPDADARFELPDSDKWEITDEGTPLKDEKSGLTYRHQKLVRNAGRSHK